MNLLYGQNPCFPVKWKQGFFALRESPAVHRKMHISYKNKGKSNAACAAE
jgi:hypothetical protein